MDVPCDEKTIWEAYRKSPDPEHRQDIINCYLEKTRMLAASLYSRRPNDSVEFSDYYHYAIQGLIEAIRTYKYEKNDNFFAFARKRIRGAVLDGVALMSEKSLQLKQQSAQQQRLETLKSKRGDKKDLFEEFIDLSLSLAIGFMLDNDVSAANEYYASTEQNDLKELLTYCVEGLEHREKAVITYHYFHEMEFTIIADILGVTRSRVAQLHKSGLQNIRAIYEQAMIIDVSY